MAKTTRTGVAQFAFLDSASAASTASERRKGTQQSQPFGNDPLEAAYGYAARKEGSKSGGGRSAAGQSASAQVLTAADPTALESIGLDTTTGFEQFRKRKTTGGGSSASAAMLGF